MKYQLACGDVMPGCSQTFDEDDKTALLGQVGEHAAAVMAGSVVASDAFYPFPDGPEAAIRAGATALIQPGGSKRDAEVIAACDEAGAAMVLTGRRHFRH